MTVDEFKTLYADISQSFVDEQIGSKIRMANLLIDRVAAFGELRNDALALMVAHMLAIDKIAGKNGDVIQTKTSKSIGGVSFTYATESGDRSWYNLSGYGQQLLFLIDLQPQLSGAFVV